MNFYNNFLKLCNEKGVSPSRAVVEAGLTKPAVNRWKNGGMPTDATAQRLADYFGVTIDAIMGDNLLWLVAKNNGQDSAAIVLSEAIATEALQKVAQEDKKRPTLFSEGEPHVNIIKIAGRDGSFREKRLDDKSLQALIAFVDLLPDVPDNI